MANSSKIKKISGALALLIISLVIYFNSKGTYIEILQLNYKGLISFFEEYQLDTTSVSSGVKANALILFPNVSSYKLRLEKENVSSRILFPATTTNLEKIQLSLHRLFLLFTEEMVIHKRPKIFKKLPFTIQKILIKSGIWSPVCDDISIISSAYLKDNIADIIYADTLFIPHLEHFITSVIYKEASEKYILGIDFQNGFWGPVNSFTNQPLTIDDLKIRIQNQNYSDLELAFLDRGTLMNKKTLIPSKYAANLFPDGHILKIYKSPFFHLYPAYRRTYATHYYLWFHLKLEDKTRMIQEIANRLFLSIPDTTINS